MLEKNKLNKVMEMLGVDYNEHFTVQGIKDKFCFDEDGHLVNAVTGVLTWEILGEILAYDLEVTKVAFPTKLMQANGLNFGEPFYLLDTTTGEYIRDYSKDEFGKTPNQTIYPYDASTRRKNGKLVVFHFNKEGFIVGNGNYLEIDYNVLVNVATDKLKICR